MLILLDVTVSFKGKTKPLKLFVLPSISQRVILGIDIWKSYNLIPDIIGSVDMLAMDSTIDTIPNFNPGENRDQCSPPKDQLDDNFYPLLDQQRQQLKAVIDLLRDSGIGKNQFDSTYNRCRGFTPIKQRFYLVSPAVKKLMFGEIDRMLNLGVIEPSNSAWSSPMRLVVKPNKVRLCLDARRLFSVTKKDTYPLPNIEGIFARLPKADLILKLDLKVLSGRLAWTKSQKL